MDVGCRLHHQCGGDVTRRPKDPKRYVRRRRVFIIEWVNQSGYDARGAARKRKHSLGSIGHIGTIALAANSKGLDRDNLPSPR